MYCKLFASLYQGTLRGCSNEILVFTNLLAHCDSAGMVDKHFRAISEETGLGIDAVRASIEILESPDPESRSPELNGARIVRMDEHRAWGWRVVNYGKYRAIRNEEDRREQNRLAQQRFREKSKPSVSDVSRVSHGKPIPSPSSISSESSDSEGDGQAELPINGTRLKSDAQRIRVGKLIGRRESTQWSAEERKLFKEIGTISEENFTLLEKFYWAEIPKADDYRRRDVLRLLKYFPGEIDKAIEYDRTHPDK